MSTQSSLKPTIIIGGGLGGLCLAQGLKRANLPFRVFERDDNASWRAQGYRIRIDGNGGQALQDTLPAHLWKLFEETVAVTVPGFTGVSALTGEATASAMSGDGRAPPRMPGPDIGPFTVDRTTLRSLLMLDLTSEEIAFRKEFTHYTVDAANDSNSDTSPTVMAHFSDGSSFAGALLVGADGVRSRVRKEYQPNHIPIDTDARAIYGKTLITPALTERFPSHALRNITLIKVPGQHPAESVALFLEPMRFTPEAVEATEQAGLAPVKDYVYWVLAGRSKPLGLSVEKLLALDHEQAKDLSLSLTKEWAPSVRSLLELQSVDNSSALRIASFKPELPMWEPKAYVTLLGDAVHVMSPTGGVGANTALRDAKRLCEVLVKGDGRLTEKAVGEYENGMREYAKAAIEGSYMGGSKIFGQPPFEECVALEL